MPTPRDRRSIDERFVEFHHNNPHIYVELVRMARFAKNAGRRKIGIRTIWEAMRWNLTIQTNTLYGDFKLNDHYTSRYVRIMMEDERDLAGFFETRVLRTE
jgi:hypothetical protein